MKELKDYLHYYLGCDSINLINGYKAKLLGIDTAYDMPCKIIQEIGTFWIKYEEIKPILRRIEDITEEELLSIVQLCYVNIFKMQGSFERIQHVYEDGSAGIICYDSDPPNNQEFRIGLTIEMERGIELSIDSSKMMLPVFDLQLHLYKLNIDLHGLIDANLAIDAATLTQTHNK